MSVEYEIINANIAQGKEGTISIVMINDSPCVLKQFKSAKSKDRLSREATLQSEAAELGIAPLIYHVDYDKKQIFMEGIQYLFIDVVKSRSPPTVTHAEKQQIVNIFNSLDARGVFHNDGNARNLMINDDMKIYLIDYGMSRRIDSKLLKKTLTPNIRYGLEALKRSLKHCGLTPW